MLRRISIATLVFVVALNIAAQAPDPAASSAPPNAAPHLEKRNHATQLIVDGQPYLMLSGELNNSSSSSLEFMEPMWQRLAAAGLNTVVTPLSWELIEPSEGTYDFALVDGLLKQARAQHLHIVFLWLASWKNGMSSYPPLWVKQDTVRFFLASSGPAAQRSTSSRRRATNCATPMRALSQPSCSTSRAADSTDHTVLMMQVENEVGILGDTRDHSPTANQSFISAVPNELGAYLKAHRDNLEPELLSLWAQHGERTTGTWEELFGNGPRADEIFMAWNYARFIDYVAARGKAAYNIPMFVNTWLGGGTPGDYPSGGPQPRVIDIWKAAGSELDLYAPDLYQPDFVGWSTRYHRPDNPLYMPETNGGAAGAANIFYAVGEHAALGFSPFAIDRPFHPDAPPEPPPAANPHITEPDLEASYKALAQIAPMILDAQQRGEIHGFLLDKAHPAADFLLGGYIAHVSLDDIFGTHADAGYGLILSTGPGTFLGAGQGFRVSFSLIEPTGSKQVGIASVDEGHFINGPMGAWPPPQRR